MGSGFMGTGVQCGVDVGALVFVGGNRSRSYLEKGLEPVGVIETQSDSHEGQSWIIRPWCHIWTNSPRILGQDDPGSTWRV